MTKSFRDESVTESVVSWLLGSGFLAMIFSGYALVTIVVVGRRLPDGCIDGDIINFWWVPLFLMIAVNATAILIRLSCVSTGLSLIVLYFFSLAVFWPSMELTNLSRGGSFSLGNFIGSYFGIFVIGALAIGVQGYAVLRRWNE